MIIPKSFFPQVCLLALVSCCLPSFSAPKEVPPNPREALKAGRPDHNRSMLDFHRKKRPLGDEQIELLHSLLDAPPERLRHPANRRADRINVPGTAQGDEGEA